jgi:hypothetical protein
MIYRVGIFESPLSAKSSLPTGVAEKHRIIDAAFVLKLHALPGPLVGDSKVRELVDY